MNARIIQMMGRPGSGKGTQAKLLAEALRAKIVSPGNDFRHMVQQANLLGRRLKEAMEAGELLPTWLAEYMFEKVLFTLSDGDCIVFESGCRIKLEAELFHEINTWLGLPYTVVYLEVSEEETKKRLLKRQTAENRPDDRSVDKRIEEYRSKTVPSVEFFKEKGTLVAVNGEQSIEEVWRDIRKALNLA